MSRAFRSFVYRIRGYRGHEITVTAPAARVYDVSFFFGRLVQDGVWQLVDKPPLPDADARYTVYVKQLADYQHGAAHGHVHQSAVLGYQSRTAVRNRFVEGCAKRSLAHTEQRR